MFSENAVRCGRTMRLVQMSLCASDRPRAPRDFCPVPGQGAPLSSLYNFNASLKSLFIRRDMVKCFNELS